MKKFKYKKELISLIAILSLSGSLIACSAVVKSDGTSKNATNSTVSTESIVSTGETTVDASDLVSDRDLDPTYIEEDTIKIELQNNTAACSSSSVSVKDSIITISSEGTYIVSGTLTDGQIVIDAGKEDKIRLILNGCSITSSDSAAIYVVSADKVFVTLAEGSTNALSNGGTFTSQNDDNIDGVIFSKDDITFNADSLREKLQKKLPYYMIPAHFTKIDTVPVKSSGKLDRNALPKPDIKNIERTYNLHYFFCKTYNFPGFIYVSYIIFQSATKPGNLCCMFLSNATRS